MVIGREGKTRQRYSSETILFEYGEGKEGKEGEAKRQADWVRKVYQLLPFTGKAHNLSTKT